LLEPCKRRRSRDVPKVARRVTGSSASQAEKRPKLIYHTEPEYPQDARERNIQGNVELSLTVGVDGLAKDIVVTKPVYPSIDESAVATVRKWRFEPAIKDGRPTPKQLKVELFLAAKPGRRTNERERNASRKNAK